MWFDKPMSSLLLPDEPFKASSFGVGDIHHEVELGVFIGMSGRHITPENAMKHVAGYFIGIDFTDRTLQSQNRQHGADWCLAKGADSFGAVSECVHKSAIPDPQNIEIGLMINKEMK